MKNSNRWVSLQILLVCAGFLVNVVVVPRAYSWGSTAHRIINLKAVVHLPDSMASLKADSLFYAAHASDPDYRKNSQDTSFFAESPRHFIDIDAYPSYRTIPHSLDSMIVLYGAQTVRARGTLPWATLMTFDSLVAQFRRGALARAESTMTDLGHYVADAHQPLHCTQNYDGGMTGNNGIHSRYETGMINAYQSAIMIVQDSVRYVSSPLDFIFDYIYHANTLVDSVLAGDDSAKAHSGWNGSGSVPPAYYAALWQADQRITNDQIQRATVALASLWYTARVSAGVTTSVKYVADLLPEGFRLEQNYPNPFNPVTEIQFSILAPRLAGGQGQLTIVKVYDVLGREVNTLVNEVKQPGTYTITFNASGLASGVYFYRLQVRPSDSATAQNSRGGDGSFVATRQMILLK